MLRPYKRLTILVPEKDKTRQAVENIHTTLRDTFGGYTEKEIFLAQRAASGVVQDPQNGKVIFDKHTSIDVDANIENLNLIHDCIIDIKHQWQKEFGEDELWMTVQDIFRIE